MNITSIFKKLIFLSIGVTLVAIGLEEFLVPNKIIDGGVIGISIITSYLTKYPLGYFIFAFNLPFLFMGYKKLGKTFALSTIYSISLLSVLVNYFHDIPDITHDLLLACIFGGIVLGIGVGVILRNNGSLDGTEIVALNLSKKLGFSVGEIIMFFNIFILSSAGFVFGWDRAMYSLIAYFVIFKTIDIVLEGLDESKSAVIVSDESEKITESIMTNLGRGVTLMEGKGGYTKDYKQIIYCVITRLELAKLKNIVYDVDPNAFMSIENIHEVMGGKVKN